MLQLTPTRRRAYLVFLFHVCRCKPGSILFAPCVWATLCGWKQSNDYTFTYLRTYVWIQRACTFLAGIFSTTAVFAQTLSACCFTCKLSRVGQNHTFIGIYGVHTVFLARKLPYIGSYVIYHADIRFWPTLKLYGVALSKSVNIEHIITLNVCKCDLSCYCNFAQALSVCSTYTCKLYG